MIPSKSKFIAAESMPIGELVKQPSGVFAYYIPAEDIDGMGSIEIRAKISKQATSIFSKNKRSCNVRTALVLTDYDGDKEPVFTRLIQVICG
jgi:hypothetical protein